MKIETATILQLRDRLLEQVEVPAGPSSGDGSAPTPEQIAALERVGPMAETMFLMMMADSECTEEERHIIGQAIHLMTDGALGPDSVDAMLARFEDALRLHGREARLAQVGALLSADRADAEAAFQLAAVVAVADDEVAAEERRLVEKLAEWLGLPSQRAAAILDAARA